MIATVPPPANRSWIDLATGVALLLAAAALSWVLIRNVRPRSQASVISRSMDAEKKP